MNKLKTKTPELDKQRSVLDQALLLSNFVDWLDSKDRAIVDRHRHTAECDPPIESRLGICGYRGGEYVPLNCSYERLFAEFFDIDLNLIEKERRALLKELKQNK